MLGSSHLVAFVATSDPARARAFYEGVLGLHLIADEPFALVFDVNGTTLRIAKVLEVMPPTYTVLGWAVTNVSGLVASLTRRGVVFERYEGLAQNDMGICTFPDGTKVAWFKDPDGNVLSLTQPGLNAA